MKVIIIAAVAENNVIGRNGEIPWHSRAELKYFKITTMGNPIVMGRKTFESIGKALPGRKNVVITRNAELFKDIEGIFTFSSLNDAVASLSEENEKIFIIGGSEIYNQAIDFADELLITRMPIEVEGDAFFPEINKDRFKLTEVAEHEEFSVEHYLRKEND